MKKTIVSIICLVFFSYSTIAQDSCFILNTDQLNSLEKPESLNDHRVLQKLGLHYFHLAEKSNKKEAFSKAIDYLEKAYTIGKSAKEFSKTAYYFGLAYLKIKNNNLAFTYIRESAKKEYLPAMFYLGKFYQNGTGTSIDYKKAAYYYKKSASAYNKFQAKASDELGRLYYHKLDDSENAALWLIKAVNLGYTRATYLLLTIDDSYAKDITIYDEHKQRALGMKFNRDGEPYQKECEKIKQSLDTIPRVKKNKHTLSHKIVPEKKDPVFPMRYSKKKKQIQLAKKRILEAIGGKRVNFSSGRTEEYPSLIDVNPLLKEAYNYVKSASIDKVYQIQMSVKSKYSFYRVYIDRLEKTCYVFVIETKTTGFHFFSNHLVQAGKVDLYNFK